MVKYIIGHFLQRSKGQLSVALRMLNFRRGTSYGMFGFSRPDLDGKKLVKVRYVLSEKSER